MDMSEGVTQQKCFSLVQPFAGLRPRADLAAKVAAPPYDVLNSQEARILAENNPYSFLRVSKAEIEFETGISPYEPRVYRHAAHNFDRMQSEGVFFREEAPSFYLYRLIMDSWVQTGVVAAASIDCYLNNRIKKHEFTRADKEEDRTRFNEALQANSGPVFLVYRHHERIDVLVNEGMQSSPLYDFVAEDGIRHTVWRIADSQAIERMANAFENVLNVYIADGHHRSAAAARYCQKRRHEQANNTGKEAYNRFLGVFFPDNQVRILDYNRVVKDLHGLSAAEFLAKVAETFVVTPQSEPYRPQSAHHMGLYCAGQWYRLVLQPEYGQREDPVARLDVSLLNDYILSPILGIHDLRRDARIDFVGGIRGLTGLMERVDLGEMKVAFALYPPSLADMMAVADSGAVMPPKSTWFEPKLRDGLVIQMLA